MSDIILRVAPPLIRYRLSRSDKRSSNIETWKSLRPGDWQRTCRVRLDQTAKHKSIVQRYVEGLPWEDTEIFKTHYLGRFRKGGQARGCVTLEQLARQYYETVDAMFARMKKDGFLSHIDGQRVDFPYIHIAADGELLLGNEGNHRIAMAKILGLDQVLLRIKTIHPDAPKQEYDVVDIPGEIGLAQQGR